MNRNQLINIISRPITATRATYSIKDSAGNPMQCISVIELKNSEYAYAAVYHTPHKVGEDKYYYKVHLSASNDLVSWAYQGVLVNNADMPEIKRIEGHDWIVLVHEQWKNTNAGASTNPCHVGFKLFYDDATLLSCQHNSSWEAPLFVSDLNGTPNIYELSMHQDDSPEKYWYVKGAIGFHFWNTNSSPNRDMVGTAAVDNLFNPNPNNPPSWQPSEASDYNEQFINAGVTGNIGQRASLSLSDGRINLQEGNLGIPQDSWDKWRIFLYEYNDLIPWPSGDGEVLQVSPQTPDESTSFGNPRISLVKSPNDPARQCVVISYFLFGEGVKEGSGEAGGLLYYLDL